MWSRILKPLSGRNRRPDAAELYKMGNESHATGPQRLILPTTNFPGLENTGERFIPEGKPSDLAFEHFHRYLLAARYASGRRILDIASGSGFGSALLAQAAESVVGIDRSEPAVRAAQATYGGNKLAFVVGDAEAVPLADAAVDLVVGFETIEHISRPAAFIQEARRVLSPQGVLLVSTPERDTYRRSRGNALNPFHLAEMTDEEFVAALQSKFEYVALYGQRVTYGSFLWPLDAPDRIHPIAHFDTANRIMQEFNLDANDGPIYLLAIASQVPQANLGFCILETENLYNPISSLRGGIVERDAEIAQLKRESEYSASLIAESPERSPLPEAQMPKKNTEPQYAVRDPGSVPSKPSVSHGRFSNGNAVELILDFRTFAEWTAWAQSNQHRFPEWRETVLKLVGSAGLVEPISGLRRRPAEITVDKQNLRESISAFELNSRKRAGLRSIDMLLQQPQKYFGRRAKAFAAEGVTRAAMILRGTMPFFLGCEYLPTEAERQTFFPVPHLDLQDIAFPDSTFDLFYSGDVFEHVPDLTRVLSELLRVLRPGGMVVSTFPFDPRRETTLTKAKILANGEIEHLVQPEYHGNPVRPEEGSLVFSLPGWDLLTKSLDIGFADSKMTLHISGMNGVTDSFWPGIFVFSAIKSAADENDRVALRRVRAFQQSSSDARDTR